MNLLNHSLFFMIVFYLASCAGKKNSGSKYLKNCSIPNDQSGTINGHWTKLAVPIAFAQNQFSNDELAAMVAAADSWNKFMQYSKNTPSIDYGGNSSSPRTSTKTLTGGSALCNSSSSIFVNNQFIGNVMIYKRAGNWPYDHKAIALTTFCNGTPSGNYPSFNNAVIEVNGQDFFISGHQPDLQSIILHEMGHLLGLDHSCEFSNPKTGMPNCNNPSLDPSYDTASLFPSFSTDPSTGQGEQRRSLGSNDETRTNCLY